MYYNAIIDEKTKKIEIFSFTSHLSYAELVFHAYNNDVHVYGSNSKQHYNVNVWQWSVEGAQRAQFP